MRSDAGRPTAAPSPPSDGGKVVAKMRVTAADGLLFADDGVLADNKPSVSLLDGYDSFGREPKWRIHDRTHLEFAVNYTVPEEAKETYIWEAYFFVPRSLKLNRGTYVKSDIYRDLQSYVRFALPALTLSEVAQIPAERIAPVLGKRQRAIRELRLFASQLRRSSGAARKEFLKCVRDDDGEDLPELALALVGHFRDILAELRKALQSVDDVDLRMTADWIDEDCSRVVESCLGSLSIELRSINKGLAATIAAGAVSEAAYRRDHGLGAVGHAKASKRDVEHLEFRRHLLKRFSSSVLWLHREVSDAGKWTLQVLYALAASFAMAFAIGMAMYHGANADAFGSLGTWAAIVIFAYAGKDRIKAALQGVFSRWVKKWMPDRRWRLEDRQTRQRLGMVYERSSFLSSKDLPDDVREARNSTRQHKLEGQARPEHVLWHQKTCQLEAAPIRAVDERFGAVTEIFRLDLREWLVHTDDPKQRTVFADPDDQHIYSAMAPRVYNIGVVFRLRTKDDESVAWRRVRVVISRKGIKRIERVY